MNHRYAIMYSCSSRSKYYLQRDIISEIIIKTSGKATYRFLNNYILYQQNKIQTSTLTIFFFDSEESLRKDMEVIMSVDRYFLFVFTDFRQPFTDIMLNNIFVECWKKALLNINILMPYGNDSMLMTTYVPFKHGCSTLKRHDLGILYETTYRLNKTFSEIYPKKAANLNNCSLIVSTFASEPFVIIDKKTNGDNINVDGIDFRLLNQLGIDLKFKPHFVVSPDKQKRGRIYANGTVTGSMQMVASGRANLTVGTYAYSIDRNALMTPSQPYVQVLLGFGISSGEDVVTALQRILSPFDFSLWISVACSLLSASIVISSTKHFNQQHRHFIIGGRLNRTPIFNMLNSFLGGSIGNPRMARITFARSIAMIWFLVTLVLRGSYQGALFDSLQGQRLHSPYDTIERIFASNCKILLMSTAATSLDEYRLDKSRYILYTYLQEAAFRKMHDQDVDGVVYANDMQVNYFNLINSPNRTIHFTKDRLYLMPVVIYFPKNTFLRTVFNDFLGMYTESGLIEYWTRKFTDIRSLSRKYEQRHPVRMKPKNIAGIIQICCALNILSLVALICEMLATRSATLKRIVEFLTY